MAKGHVKLLCGMSGSGKTTYADTLVKNHGYSKLAIDEYMWHDHGECGIDYPAEEYRERYARSEEALKERLIDLVASGSDVVVDMTFCHREKRDLYRGLLDKHGIGWELVYFPVDFLTAWERIYRRNNEQAGPNKARVTKQMLTQFYNGFERPGEDEVYRTASSSSTEGDS
ncbi:MAG: ATP-binding protein [Muribaculum sp.]|nr:ATP-binding protein [Muribaculum sp.]